VIYLVVVVIRTSAIQCLWVFGKNIVNNFFSFTEIFRFCRCSKTNVCWYYTNADYF